MIVFLHTYIHTTFFFSNFSQRTEFHMDREESRTFLWLHTHYSHCHSHICFLPLVDSPAALWSPPSTQCHWHRKVSLSRESSHTLAGLQSTPRVRTQASRCLQPRGFRRKSSRIRVSGKAEEMVLLIWLNALHCNLKASENDL